MARNPRIKGDAETKQDKGDVTPNKKRKARNEERHYR
jgi:hypothetical protein